MFKPKGMLKVVSVLMIIFSVLGLIIVVMSYAMLPKLMEISASTGLDTSLLESAYTPLSVITSLVSSVSSIAAGIFGVSGKSFKGALITMGIYTVLLVISTIQSIMTTGFMFTLIISFVLPVLYWWGLYQSKE